MENIKGRVTGLEQKTFQRGGESKWRWIANLVEGERKVRISGFDNPPDDFVQVNGSDLELDVTYKIVKGAGDRVYTQYVGHVPLALGESKEEEEPEKPEETPADPHKEESVEEPDEESKEKPEEGTGFMTGDKINLEENILDFNGLMMNRAYHTVKGFLNREPVENEIRMVNTLFMENKKNLGSLRTVGAIKRAMRKKAEEAKKVEEEKQDG